MNVPMYVQCIIFKRLHYGCTYIYQFIDYGYN